MGMFDTLMSGVLLVFVAWSSYSLLQHRADLFSRANLSKSFTFIGVLTLVLAGFVALLAYSLPQNDGPVSSQSIERHPENNVSGRTEFYDRRL